MGTWGAYELEGATLNGISQMDWPKNSNAFENEVDAGVLACAKEIIQTLIVEKWAATVLLAGGEVVFFDLAAAFSDGTKGDVLKPRTQLMLGLAYFYWYYADLAGRPGRGTAPGDKAKGFYDLLKKAVGAFMGLAPSAMGLTTGVSARGNSSYLVSGVSRYD